MTHALRPYQRNNTNEILGCLQASADPLYVLPTGGGKTEVFTEVISDRLGDGWESCIFVHRVELLRQASERLHRKGIPHGIIAPEGEFQYSNGVTRRYDGQLTSHPVHVASIDTVAARMGSLKPYIKRLDLGIPDEAHHSVAPKWESILEMLRRRFGVTATPCRTDGKGIGSTGLFKRMVRGPSIAELTGMGFLAPAEVYAPPCGLDLSKVGKRGGDYVLREIAKIVDTDVFSMAARRHYAKLSPGQPAVIFCTTVEHAKNVALAFSQAGWRAASVDGTMSARDRDSAIGGLADGRVQVLTSCELVGEGLDIPAVSTALLLRPTASTGLFLQQIGRCLRPHADKTNAFIIDLVTNTMRHGMYDASRQWDLTAGIKGLERAVAATWRCRKCNRVQSRPNESTVMRCPCGAAQKTTGFSSAKVEAHPPIAGIEAERLMSMKFDEAVKLLKTYSDLVAYGKLREMSQPFGWAKAVIDRRQQMRARYQPRSLFR